MEGFILVQSDWNLEGGPLWWAGLKAFSIQSHFGSSISVCMVDRPIPIHRSFVCCHTPDS